MKQDIIGVNMIDTIDRKFISKILTRASKEGLYKANRNDHKLDLMVVHVREGLNLQRLLKADGLTFAHDFLGIYRHLNRDKLELMDCWLPRCLCRE